MIKRKAATEGLKERERGGADMVASPARGFLKNQKLSIKVTRPHQPVIRYYLGQLHFSPPAVAASERDPASPDKCKWRGKSGRFSIVYCRGQHRLVVHHPDFGELIQSVVGARRFAPTGWLEHTE